MNSQDSSPQGGKIIVRVDPDLEDLIPDFLEMRREDVQTLSLALEKGDYKTIEILGHSMKGSGGGYGFDKITDIGRSIEDAAKIQDAGKIKKMTEELKNYLERVDVVYS